MTTLLLLVLGFANFTSTPPVVQLDAVIAALSSGDAQAVGTYFDKTVELVLPGVEDIVTKEKATAQLATFFTAHKPKSFTRVHGGTSTGEEGAYVIGTLFTESGKFRVYLYGKGSVTPIIQELRIEVE